MNVLSDFIIRVEDNTSLKKGDFQEMKEAATEVAESAQKIVKKASKKTKASVKKTVSKTKNLKFDDIKDMSNAAIKKVLKEIDVEDIAIALKDAEKEVTEKIIPNLGVQAKKKYEEIQSDLSKIKKSDISKYRKNIESKIKDIFSK